MKFNLSHLLLLGALAYAHEQQPKILSLPMKRSSETQKAPLAQRDSVIAGLDNYWQVGRYAINLTVGTPGQLVQLQLDTGSSDLWVHSSEECPKVDCIGGSFNMEKSSSATVIDENGFKITYGTAGSFVSGDFIHDDVKISGKTLEKVILAVATASKNEASGILGVGFDQNESTQGTMKQYHNFIDMLVEQKIISTRVYSLYLDDLEASTGQVIFGGYDTEKFTGELYSLPIQPDADTGTISTMTVALTSLGIENADNQVEYLTGDNVAIPALLDSGTTYTLVPEDIFEQFFYYSGAVQSNGYNLVDCELLANTEGTVNFGFGGTDGPVIKVPFSEFAIPSTDPLKMPNGNTACKLGMAPSDDWILGDTFLRSAYVVYNLDNLAIGLAQTVFNTTSSNVKEIGGDDDNVGTSVSQTVTVYQSATGVPGQDSGATAVSIPASATGQFTLTGAITQAPTATGTASGTQSAASATPTSSANRMIGYVEGSGLFLAVTFVAALVAAL